MTKSLSPIAQDVLASIHQHGLLSTPHLHALHTPGVVMRRTQRILDGSPKGLAGWDPPLVQSIATADWSGTHVHFLTPAGLDMIPSSRLEDRPRAVTPEQAAGGMQRHTLLVNTVGVAFVMAARARDDSCGPLAWRHEIEHAISAPKRGRGRGGAGVEFVRPDALLRYDLFTGGKAYALSRFIELDRGTMQMEDVVEKLRRYARLWSYVAPGGDTPVWQAVYPLGFPEVLVVFADRPRAHLEKRMLTLLAHAAADPVIAAAEGLVISCTLLEDLVALQRGTGKDKAARYVVPPAGGPFAPVCIRHDRLGTYVDWLGHTNGGQGVLL